MTNPITVTVTQDDIDNGERGACAYCPIALAIKHLGYEIVTVGAETVAIANYDNCDARYYHLPDEAAAFVYEFDRRKPVKPFSFVLDRRF